MKLFPENLESISRLILFGLVESFNLVQFAIHPFEKVLLTSLDLVEDRERKVDIRFVRIFSREPALRHR
jgi:hypothetical protein